MTAPTIKRNAAKKPLISGRRPDMTMPFVTSLLQATQKLRLFRSKFCVGENVLLAQVRKPFNCYQYVVSLANPLQMDRAKRGSRH
jgi:hypothetical protein